MFYLRTHLTHSAKGIGAKKIANSQTQTQKQMTNLNYEMPISRRFYIHLETMRKNLNEMCEREFSFQFLFY